MDKGLDGRGHYRAIYSALWDDADFRKLTPNEKLVFLNLRTSPLTNLPVIYPYYLEAISKQTGLSQGAIKRAMNTLSDTHWIAFEEGIVWVKKGLKYDPNIFLTNPKHVAAVKNALLGLPKLKIVKDFIEFYQIKIPYHLPYEIGNEIPNVLGYAKQEKEKEKEKEEEKEEEKEYEEKGKPKIPQDLIFSISKSKDLNQKTDIQERKRILEQQAEMLRAKGG